MIDRWLAFVLSVPLVACTSFTKSPAPADAPADWLQDIVNVEVDETAELSTGNLMYGVRAPNGYTFVSDESNARVLEISPTGTLRRLFGRRGSGPGEFNLGGPVSLLSDSVLAAVDGGLRRITLYDLSGDSVLRVVPGLSPEVGVAWNVEGKRASFALTAADSVLGVWEWQTGVPVARGASSPRIKTNQLTVLQHGRPEVVRHKNGWLAVFAAEPGLHVLDSSANRIAVIPLPSRTRRGVPPGIFELAAKRYSNPTAPRALEPIGSMVAGMARLSSGEIAVVFLDAEQIAVAKRGASPDALFGNIALRVSLVSDDLSEICIDGRIPVKTEVAPIPFFSGDTIFVLAKQLVEDTVDVRVRGFVIRPAKCRWEPIGTAEGRP